ncbi:hypothetical protein I551_0458 [Mycobacterium ulcerans str. Harvey]|uniref:Uncharacterized protein n=1 Tax=Mycobacterium ulcerans str. Harvey TaxID=1299332 RepID=A0ABN0R7V8_MYCUL|nr:hypothetical protein I551_0458 [Mycobacterium ulcerans str. Harvey]
MPHDHPASPLSHRLAETGSVAAVANRAATPNGAAFTASCAAGHHRIPHNERMS